MRPSPWLLPVLILVVLLGHACDVTALVELPDAHHGGEGHSGDEGLACDGVGLLSAAPRAVLVPTLAVAMADPISPPASVRAAAEPRPDSSPPAQRPRLFILFASFII